MSATYPAVNCDRKYNPFIDHMPEIHSYKMAIDATNTKTHFVQLPENGKNVERMQKNKNKKICNLKV